jgi:hypothetical protein
VLLKLSFWIWILVLAPLLIVPTALNVFVGSRAGVWWAPFPFWILLLHAPGVPLAATLFVPSALFLLLSVSLATRSLAAKILLTAAVAAGCFVQIAWAVFWFREGVWRMGLAYTIAVQGLGVAILVVAVWLLAIGWRRTELMRLVLSAWSTALWLASFAVPWLGEAI